jgi:hypothetical protein
MIDHDRLFKELITTFFIEFIELFFPQVTQYLDSDYLEFLDKELFTDVTTGEKQEVDLIAKVRFKGQETFFLVHIEAQSSPQKDFNYRLFTYFARLHQQYRLPIYPIVIFSYDRPKTPAPHRYQVGFEDLNVLDFNYRVIQLNRLQWRDFLSSPNPISSALMAKMAIAPEDRPKVKAECLRLLVSLKLNPAKMQLISGFVDTYLLLNPEEELQFNQELSTFIESTQEEVMQLTTSWMRQGLEQGLEQGLSQGKRETIKRLILKKFGAIADPYLAAIEHLGLEELESLTDVFLDFNTIQDLEQWLNTHTGFKLIPH